MIFQKAVVCSSLLWAASASVPDPFHAIVVERAVPLLPVHGGGLELPPPSMGLTFKAVVLGLGTQNYSCTSSGNLSQPVSVGAVANLYDLSRLPPTLFDSVTALASNLDHATMTHILPLAGRHYFDVMSTPTFELDGIGVLHAKKVANIAAPVNALACPVGRPQIDAVDWLKLDDNGVSRELRECYRVRTVGGKPPATCKRGAPTVLVPYVAQYWFYG